MTESFLYLVFHGLIGFVHQVKARRVRVLLFKMEDHRVAAGHWLTEHDIPQSGVITVSNIADDGAEFLDPEKNTIVQLESGFLEKDVYAQMDLPLPQQVFSLRKTDLSSELAGNDIAKLSSPVHHAVQVFKYRMTDDNVRLESASFSFISQAGVLVPSADARITVIHVLNEPVAEVSDDHAKAEFRKGASALGADLSLSVAPDFPNSGSDVLPPGLIPAEALPLTTREFSVNVLLAGIRRNAAVEHAESIGASKVCGTISGKDGG